jgi:alkaline phosphatase D
MYADGVNMDQKKRAYAKLAAFPGFRELKRTTRVLAVWDDHDYGYNDAGGDYPAKKASQRLFLDFLKEPADSPRRKRQGVYESYYFGEPPRRVQIILLDTRYFRDPLEKVKPDPPFRTAYRPTADVSKTLLGSAQWEWLETELRKPADIRVLASGIQLVSREHRGEKWENFPHEKARLYGLIRKTGAGGLVVISGDRHYAEFSVDHEGVPYPVYDFTSSGLNTFWALGAEEPNGARIAGPVVAHNFGILVIDWKKRTMRSEIRDIEGKTLITHTVSLGELRIK